MFLAWCLSGIHIIRMQPKASKEVMIIGWCSDHFQSLSSLQLSNRSHWKWHFPSLVLKIPYMDLFCEIRTDNDYWLLKFPGRRLSLDPHLWFKPLLLAICMQFSHNCEWPWGSLKGLEFIGWGRLIEGDSIYVAIIHTLWRFSYGLALFVLFCFLMVFKSPMLLPNDPFPYSISVILKKMHCFFRVHLIDSFFGLLLGPSEEGKMLFMPPQGRNFSNISIQGVGS